ncbi:PEP-CTERM sorting domain-containing protein [Tropicibacter sp. S64]|uniref:PEP-CTERM sorting domain-containing protein n=1 Tax=Tropicibacter sp. S64 TaxID=3415122 RepID=UPI003C7CCA91
MTLKATLAAATLCAACASASSAAVLVNIWEDGTDVLAYAAGSLDLTGAASQYLAGGAPFISPDSFLLGEDGVGPSMDAYQFTGSGNPTSFGTGSTMTSATSGTVTEFGMTFGTAAGGNTVVYIEQGYTFGTIFTSNAFFQNRTLTDMDLIAGSYVFSLPFDTITVEVGTAPPAGVPLPATALLSLLGLGALGWAGRRRKG